MVSIMREAMPFMKMDRTSLMAEAEPALSPARVIRMDQERGTLKQGALADVVIFDPDAVWTVDPEKFRSKGRNTPYAGKTLVGRVETTICGGKIVYRNEEA